MNDVGNVIPLDSRLGGLVDMIGRVLTCTECRAQVPVLEVCQGARTDQEHQWIRPADFVCGGCHTDHEEHDHASGLRAVIERAREQQKAAKSGRGIPYKPEVS